MPKVSIRIDQYCSRNYILFTKLPWQGDSEGTLQSSSRAATCLPHTVEASQITLALLMLSVKLGSCVYQLYYSLWLDPTGNRT